MFSPFCDFFNKNKTNKKILSGLINLVLHLNLIFSLKLQVKGLKQLLRAVMQLPRQEMQMLQLTLNQLLLNLKFF